MCTLRHPSTRNHRILRIRANQYRLYWSYDRYYSGSQLRFPRTTSRDTNLKGAERFAKKWKLKMPQKNRAVSEHQYEDAMDHAESMTP